MNNRKIVALRQYPHPTVLVIIDGFAFPPEGTESQSAVTRETAPNLYRLFDDQPSATMPAHGVHVGLFKDDPGNSEVGHLVFGAGKVLVSDHRGITEMLANDGLKTSDPFQDLLTHAKTTQTPLHLIGLLSDGGVHSNLNHLRPMLKEAKAQGVTNVYIHAITDGRDVPPRSAQTYVDQLQRMMDEVSIGSLASISGRDITMDRARNWSKTEQSYAVLVNGDAATSTRDVSKHITDHYQTGESVTDQTIPPILIQDSDGNVHPIQSGSVFAFNFRKDRMIQLAASLDPTCTDFTPLKSKDDQAVPNADSPLCQPLGVKFVSMVQYHRHLTHGVVYTPDTPTTSIGAELDKRGIPNARVTETEKQTHVGKYMDHRDDPFPTEQRQFRTSYAGAHNERPEMQVAGITDDIEAAVKSHKVGAVIVNYPPPDMVGHTGVYEATQAGVKAVDEMIPRLVALARQEGARLIIISDHGNAEKMIDAAGQPVTSHTANDVPVIYAGYEEKSVTIKAVVYPADIAPTMMALIDRDNGITDTPNLFEGQVAIQIGQTP